MRNKVKQNFATNRINLNSIYSVDLLVWLFRSVAFTRYNGTFDKLYRSILFSITINLQTSFENRKFAAGHKGFSSGALFLHYNAECK